MSEKRHPRDDSEAPHVKTGVRHAAGRRTNMLPSDQEKAYREFYNSARHNKILDAKTTLMIHLASAIAFACYP